MYIFQDIPEPVLSTTDTATSEESGTCTFDLISRPNERQLMHFRPNRSHLHVFLFLFFFVDTDFSQSTDCHADSDTEKDADSSLQHKDNSCESEDEGASVTPVTMTTESNLESQTEIKDKSCLLYTSPSPRD